MKEPFSNLKAHASVLLKLREVRIGIILVEFFICGFMKQAAKKEVNDIAKIRTQKAR